MGPLRQMTQVMQPNESAPGVHPGRLLMGTVVLLTHWTWNPSTQLSAKTGGLARDTSTLGWCPCLRGGWWHNINSHRPENYEHSPVT